MKEPNVAGAFYPSDPISLKQQLNDFFEQAGQPEDDFELKALIAPHAGYVYSGKTAASAYAYLDNKDLKKVFLLAPSHYYSFTGAAIYDGEKIQTLLAETNISKVADQLAGSNPLIIRSGQPYEKEHALEVQLPFIQNQLTDFELIPMILGQIDPQIAASLAGSIADVWDQQSLMVISTDLAHFHQAELNDKKDRLTMELIEQGDSPKLFDANRNGESELCGLGPVMVMMELAGRMNWKIKILEHTNSGMITGDMNSVVGYFAAVYYQ
jgi:AmmeMemoRadiSam system protein B